MVEPNNIPHPLTTQSSPADTFLTALQDGPSGPREMVVPWRLFEAPAVEPAKTYMEREADGDQLVMEDVKEAAAEEGDTDSAVDSSECLELEDASQAAFWDRVGILIKKEDDVEAHVMEEEENFELKRGDSSLNFPLPPPDWKPAPTKPELGVPEFSTLDNPGGWPEFSFRPKFLKADKKKKVTAKYLHHALPTGARPVPMDDAGKRVSNGWSFEYGEWNGNTAARSNASRENPFPKERRSLLDYALLQRLGMKRHTIIHCNPLLFYQLLLPLGDPKLNSFATEDDVFEDPRLPYYSEVEQFTSKYAAGLGMGGSYGHSFSVPKIPELLKFDMTLIRDGVLGGSKGAIHLRWKEDDALFSKEISQTMTHTRWLQLKRTYKLNDNDFDKSNTDPCKKFDHIFKCIVHNTNVLTKFADSDQCMDETTFGHAGYGPAGAGVMRRLIGKKVTKGGQIVLCADVGRNRVRAYTNRHRLHKGPEDWGREGSCETRRIVNALDAMVLSPFGNRQCTPRGIFRGKPHITADNYFGEDKVDEWMGEMGFGFLHTVRRDCLPRGVPDWAWHKSAVLATDQKARDARFQNPITAVQPNLTYTRVHVSFQSTGPTNISCVNSLNSNKLFSRVKSRGAGKNKRQWVIEMNDARQLYLGSYGRIDTIDQMLVKCSIFYITWKYWHAAKNHALALAVVTAYDMYLECATDPAAREFFGITDELLPQQKILSFHQFRDKLSLSGLRYNPIFKEYLGDERMRVNTKMTKGQRKRTLLDKESPRKKGRPAKGNEVFNVVTPAIFERAKKDALMKKRLCGSLTKYVKHGSSIGYLDNKISKKGRKCCWCGKPTWSYCGICKDPVTKEPLFLHHCPRTGANKGKICFTHAHNDDAFGLGKKDCLFLGTQQKSWSEPTKKKLREHAAAIAEIRTELETNEFQSCHRRFNPALCHPL